MADMRAFNFTCVRGVMGCDGSNECEGCGIE